MVRRRFEISNAFKRDLKKHYLSLASVDWAIVSDCLLKGYEMPVKYKDHARTGNWNGWRDCHIANDLVLIYKINGETLHLARLNSHSEVFG